MQSDDVIYQYLAQVLVAPVFCVSATRDWSSGHQQGQSRSGSLMRDVFVYDTRSGHASYQLARSQDLNSKGDHHSH